MLVILGIDQLKRGRGPLVAKTVAATLLVVFSSVLNNVMQIRQRSLDAGVVNPTDEVLMAERLLEASLMGFSLFLAVMIDRLHNYIKELHQVRDELEDLKRSKQDYEDKKSRRMEETKRGGVKELESDPRRKAKEAKTPPVS